MRRIAVSIVSLLVSTAAPSRKAYDIIIIGAGFYGCALALFLARQGKKVLICDSGQVIMERASAVNQARVHAGYHYPRNYRTALRSRHNRERFLDEYAPAIMSDFTMLYAVARHRSKVDARRFGGMFEAMGAPIERAVPAQRRIFDADRIEEVFVCQESAFDYRGVRALLLDRLKGLQVEICLSATVEKIELRANGVLAVRGPRGLNHEAPAIYNISYAGLNAVLGRSNLALLPVKHELVEVALIERPDCLRDIGVTVMDGEFFSSMPWPAAGLYSLTHVRYSPHYAWIDAPASSDAYQLAETLPRETRWRQMVADARRYIPGLSGIVWRRSLFDIKTVPLNNERDDGRPILIMRHDDMPGLSSVLGSKIDNIYDLFEAVADT